MIIVYITYPNMDEAKKVVNHLLDKRLIACANFFPVQSVFRWEGKITNSEEVVSICKTKEENWSKIKSEVKKLHSYDVPCIINLNAEANEEFEAWVKEETK
jgi:periplasmic divalent cation tolerance protein